jgi:exosortase A-associated hydrolase 2
MQPSAVSRAALEPQFVAMPGADRGVRLVVCHRPISATRATIVHVHPFAEEMNKSRRMAALQARALAHAGFMVCRVDLLGCGDSSGEFGAAGWSDWVRDVMDTSRWALQRGTGPLLLWGLRAGCLLAVEAARELDEVAGLILWQPAPSGLTVLQQFLRLKLATDLQAAGAKGVVDAMRAQLQRGEPVQVAGYELAPSLAAGLEQARLEPLGRELPVAWIEIANRPRAELLPASRDAVERWRQAGHRVDTSVVSGPPFWNSLEIEEAPALLDATVAAAEALLL